MTVWVSFSVHNLSLKKIIKCYTKPTVKFIGRLLKPESAACVMFPFVQIVAAHRQLQKCHVVVNPTFA